MTRRPLEHPVGRLAKAQQRMAPGGLLWSESPIPRRYSPRVPMAGEDEPVTPITFKDYGYYQPSTGMFTWKDPRVAGDTLICVVCGLGTITPPAGWTTVLSGTLDGEPGASHTWVMARGASVGGSEFVQEGQFTGTDVSRAAGMGYLYTGGTQPTALIGSVSVHGPGATSVPVKSVTGTTLGTPVQVLIYLANSPAGFTGLSTTPPQSAGFNNNGGPGPSGFVMEAVRASLPPNNYVDATLFNATGTGMNAVTFAFGLA